MPPLIEDSLLCQQITSVVYRALLQLCGGPDGPNHEEKASSTTTTTTTSATLGQELQYLAETNVTLLVHKSTPNDPLGVGGKPWNVEVRVAPAIYHRWSSSSSSSSHQRKGTNHGSVLQVTSDMGVTRNIHSAHQLGQLLLTAVEDGCRDADIASDVRCNAAGFLCIVTPTRVVALRAADRLPCPVCVQWLKGPKGLWWHCQQQHAQEHSLAVSSTVSANHTLALIPYTPNSIIITAAATSAVVDQDTTIAIAPVASKDVDNDPLVAVQRGDLLALQRHVDQHGYDPATTWDRKGASPLLWAAGAGHLEMVMYLIVQCRCDPATRQRGKRAFSGRTALHWAARKGHLNVVEYLVTSCQVDLEAATADGTTAFCWAAWQGHTTVLHFLQAAGCEVQRKNVYGCNAALWCAQGEGNPATMEWLQSVGCPIAAVNSNGHGAFHKAAQRGRRDICEWLCDNVVVNGSTIDLQLIGPDSDGCTPSDLAGMEGHDEALAMWIASKEIELVEMAVREKSFKMPKWMDQVPDGVAMMAQSYELVWEPWAGLRRLRFILDSTDIRNMRQVDAVVEESQHISKRAQSSTTSIAKRRAL